MVDLSRRRQADARQIGLSRAARTKKLSRRSKLFCQARAVSARRSTAPCSMARSYEPVARFFDEMMALGLDGITVSPGYASRACARPVSTSPNRERTKIALFRDILSRGNGGKKWAFTQSGHLFHSISSRATRPMPARRGRCRKHAMCSAGKSPVICSAKAM